MCKQKTTQSEAFVAQYLRIPQCPVAKLFAPLSQGGTIILADNLLQLPSLAAAQKVTLLNTVPSALAELLRFGGVPESVRTTFATLREGSVAGHLKT